MYPDFNPRAHEGHDSDGGMCVIDELISIHVPTRGTTEYCLNKDAVSSISIHVPTRGTTPDAMQVQKVDIISIHVPTRGTTIVIL